MKVTDCIMCPKCNKPFLKYTNFSSIGGREWYCHKCHTEFTTHELTHEWGLDAGDLFGESPVMLVHQFPHPNTFEPEWETEQERVDAYQMVTRMFLDIPEFDDYTDLVNTQLDAQQIGV